MAWEEGVGGKRGIVHTAEEEGGRELGGCVVMHPSSSFDAQGVKGYTARKGEKKATTEKMKVRGVRVLNLHSDFK